MTASDRFALDTLKAAAFAHAKLLIIWIVGAFVLSIAYCAGMKEQQRQDADAMRRALADSSRAIEGRITSRTDTIRVVEHQAAAARQDARQAIQHFQRHVTVVSDTGTGAILVAVDSAIASKDVPADLAIPAIQTCARALVADSIEVQVLDAQIVDLTKDRDTWKARAELDERQATHHRFGFKTGAVVGALATVAVKLILR